MSAYRQLITLGAIGLFASLVFLLFSGASSLLAQYDGMSESELESELQRVERQREEARQNVQRHQAEAASIERDIAVLESQIESAQLNIQAKTITIQQLSQDIGVRSQNIEELEDDIERLRSRLAHLLRQTNEQEAYSLVEVLLSNENLSEFFIDVNDFNTIKDSLHDTLAEIRSAREQNAEEREELSVRQRQEIDARQAIEEERRSIEQKEAELQRLLDIQRSQASQYQEVVQQRQQEAAQIRSALFALRDTDDIPFGDALTFARRAQQATGVRPAFLLAVFQQESGLRDGHFGVNVGTCNRPGDSRGWRDIMPGPNDNSWRDDQTVYLQLMEELGRDPDIQPLSCPWQGGWGGAMGPAQFIPHTWNTMKDRVARAVGVSVADPWNPEHAFMASAMYLADLGAAGGGWSAERNAACRYYSGRTCDSSNPPNSFYGDGVMQKSQQLQRDIDVLDSV